MDVEQEKKIAIKGNRWHFVRITKPSSGSVNLLFRRGGVKAMLAATKNTGMDPKMVALMVGLATFSIGFLAAFLWHPGYITGPPPGYYFKAVPVPTNATVVG